MLRSLGFGLGLETFAKFLMISVSVSKNLVSEKKVSVSVSENLVLEKKYRFRRNLVSEKVAVSVSKNLILEKKYRFRRNQVSEKSCSFGFQKFDIGKKYWYWFRSKYWYRHSVTETLSSFCQRSYQETNYKNNILILI